MEITKKSINKRFVMSIEYLLKGNKNINKGYISQLLKISPSKFSEILNNRMNVGTDTLALLCNSFDVNPEWLLTGKGDKIILRSDDLSPSKDDYIIELQRDKIIQLEKEILDLKKQIEANKTYRLVSESQSELEKKHKKNS